MSNRLQLLRTTTTGKVPTLAELLDGELALNLTDKQVYIRMGGAVEHLNSAAFIVQDSNNRFVTDAQITTWSTPYVLPTATALVKGGVKIGQNISVDVDGTIHIPFANTTTSGILSTTDWNTFNNKEPAIGYTTVNKAGDTMTGHLVLNADPVASLQAATKQYVDNGLDLKVNLAGATMTGLLTLSGDPVASLQAATKQYVDQGLSSISGRYAAPMTDKIELTAVLSTAIQDRQLRLVESNGSIYRYDVQAVDAVDGDGVLAPDDVTPPAPGRWIKVQGATQSHNALVGLQGGTTNDYLHLTTTEKNSYDSHLTDTTKHLTTSQNNWIDNINATSTEVNYLVGVTSLVQTQLNGKEPTIGYVPVNQAGDTMLGFLHLYADPTAATHAANKQWVENRVIDAGTF